jgi:tRNA(Arg) A34 adenosine deaminase TadA
MSSLSQHDAGHLRRAIELSREARERGDEPFGAVLVSADGRVLAEGLNSEITARDVTGHAETNLLRDFCMGGEAEELGGATLYASGEPCAMCAGTIFWSGVGRVVYAASAGFIHERLAKHLQNPTLNMSCREVLAAGTRATEVIGPVLEEEAAREFGESPD